MKRLRLGIIGAGSMGENHIRIALTLSGVKLAAISDTDPQRLSAFSVPTFEDYHQLLAEVDAVIVATPTQTHFQIAKDCIEAGKYLVVEKPFTGSSEKARELTDLAKTKGVLLTVNLIERFNPAFQEFLIQM